MSEEDRRLANRYQLTRRIGGGAMGVVWQGQDDHLGRMVAVKELLLQEALDEDRAEEARTRAIREGRNAARLHHPHAITVFDVVEEQGRPWLVMEYLPSQSLAVVLAERGRLPVDEVIRIGGQLASALAAAHRADIVHRDVKPGNVLIGADGTVKISDFGISRAAGDATITATGQIAGTPAFLAPEVARGEHSTFAADVFSLGATLYAAVEGAPPFGYGDNVNALLYRVASGAVVPAGNAGVLAPVLSRLLAPRIEDRPSMTEAVRLLEQLRGEPEADPSPRHVPPVARTAGRRPDVRRVAVVFAVVALLGAGALFFALSQGDNGTRASAGKENPASVRGTAARSPSPSRQAPERTAQTQPAPPRPTQVEPAGSRTPARALTNYYALLPEDLAAGYARLTDNFKRTNASSFASYQGFWSQMRSVNVSDVRSQGGNTVSADITYVYTSGKTVRERTTYTLVRNDRQWAIDSQEPG